MSADLITWVKENVSNLEFYKRKFPEWDGNHNTNVSCPFKDKHKNGDIKPSLSLNINGKGGAFCHACGTKIGSPIHFVKATGKKRSSDEVAASLIYNEWTRPVLSAPENVHSILNSMELALKGAPQILESLKNDLMLSPTTIEKFQLGWLPQKRRISIPILDKFGQLINVRRYRLPSMRTDEKFPKILNTDGYGTPAAIFPCLEIFSLCSGQYAPPVIYWFTGERDTLLAWDRGIPGFCYTTGENVCKKEWIDEIRALNGIIAIVVDNDEIGTTGAQKRKAALEYAKIDCFLVEFDQENIKDFSDFIKIGHTVEEFLALGIQNPRHEPQEQQPQHENDQPPYYFIPRIDNPVQLKDVGEYSVYAIGRRPELLNRPIRTKAIVSGRMERTYSIPYIFRVGEIEYRLPVGREMVSLVRNNDEQILKEIKLWLATKAKIQILGHLTVTEVEIIPLVEPGIDSPYVNQRCYFFGERIECNKPYLMRIIPTTDMRSQETIGLIVEMEPISNILDCYKFDENSYKLLQDEFLPDPNISLIENLRQLVHEMSIRHTGILNRNDLHIVCLLNWLCPLQFEFPFEGIQRGWINALVLGDTQTGKSVVCQKLVELFSCGVFISSESCSFVGLVGGAVKSSSGMFILRWGKIPLYNRQLVIMEELSGISTEDISHMSEIRSAGVARYDKGGLTGETPAKTRLLCLSNVRGKTRNLGDYPTGAEAALELVGQHEDLARFDMILTVTDEEVSNDIINQDRSKTEQLPFSEKEIRAFRELAMFAWSLKPEQIDFTVSAYRQCLVQTLELSKKYHPSIPIFKAGSGRLKLARLAISIACVQFAWDTQAHKLTVTADHINAAAELLHALYQKPSFGYARFSKSAYTLNQIVDEPKAIHRIQETFKEREIDFLNYVSHSLSFSKFDIAEAMGAHQMFVERVISQLFLSNLLRKGEQKGEWRLSTTGRKWVEKRIIGKTVI